MTVVKITIDGKRSEVTKENYNKLRDEVTQRVATK